MFSLFDIVVLENEILDKKLSAGQLGVVIDVYEEPFLAYGVEFCDTFGQTLAELILLPNQLHLAKESEIKTYTSNFK